MGKKSSWKKKYKKAAYYGIIYAEKLQRQANKAKQPCGSACGKCLKCDEFKRKKCAGLFTYWAPHCKLQKGKIQWAEKI